MASSQRTHLALFKRKEATRNKEVIDISDDDGKENSETPKGWNINYSYKELT